MLLQYRTLFLLPILTFLHSSISIQIWPTTQYLPATLPAACLTALTANISCTPELITASSVALQVPLSSALLTSYCTTSCYSSLKSFQQNVDSKCGNASYVFTNKTTQSLPQVVDPLVWAYNVSCIKDTNSSAFCLPGLLNGSYSACSNCALKYGQNLLGSTYGSVRIDKGSFSSILSSCSIPASKYPIPTSTIGVQTVTTNSSSPNPTSTCASKYTVQLHDTCQSIASAKSIATDRLITANNLDYNCSTLVVGSQLCLGSTCTLQTVTRNMTCGQILANKTFYLSQLVSWNPTIHANCDNLGSMVGRSICISPPGTTWNNSAVSVASVTGNSSVFVVPTSALVPAPSGSTTPNYTTNWFVPTALPPIPIITALAANLTVINAYNAATNWCPITANDTSSGFNLYDLPSDCVSALVPYCDPSPPYSALPSTTFAASCSPSYYQTPQTTTTTPTTTTALNTAPTQSGIISSCNRFYNVSSGDTCSGIVAKFGTFTLAQFYSWNPAVGSSCQSLFVGYDVCVGIPGTPTSPLSSTSAPSTTAQPSPLPSTISPCAKYHTVVSGDTCSALETTFGITAAQFNAWNPYVGSTCANLWLGYEVCVAVPASSTTATTTTTASATVPSPLEPSTISTCTKYYQVKSGDTCAAIESTYGISTTNFNTWNPYVGSTCANLWLGYYICIG